MNPAEKLIRAVDAAQQRHQPAAFLYGVVKKFGDDNGGALVSNLAYSGFVSVFPLLLILVTVLVNVAAGAPSLRIAVIAAATRQFPYIGQQLASNIHGLHKAAIPSLIVGLLLLVWGVTRLAQAGLYTMEQVWNLPGPARPGYLPRLARSVVFLCVLAVGLVVSTALGGLVTYGRHSVAVAVAVQALAVLANVGLYFASFRVLTPKGVPNRQLLPGAIAGGIFWTILQAVGAYLVHHYLRSDSVYGVFATVLGLLAWIYFGVQATVYAAEVNVVLARRLWPRAMVQPPLTEADRASMALQALQNQRRPEQEVQVTFTDRPAGAKVPAMTPRTAGDVSPPAQPAKPAQPIQPAHPAERAK
ncbi:MAG TPA: YihY/virulence factor BrkB family protein [Streptosporangiaceae bacterium]|nr:YihY/virulence factor BrkB family protein [Streptosporangiaceae bacterium]